MAALQNMKLCLDLSDAACMRLAVEVCSSRRTMFCEQSCPDYPSDVGRPRKGVLDQIGVPVALSQCMSKVMEFVSRYLAILAASPARLLVAFTTDVNVLGNAIHGRFPTQ